MNSSIISQGKNSFINFAVNHDFTTTLYVHGSVLKIFIALIALLIIYKFYSAKNYKSFEVNEAEIGIGNQKVKLKPNITDMQIAYKIWVELSTRKIGLEIDPENDVISEIYNSWYNFFAITRELVKDVPVNRFRRKDTEKIIKISINVLNDGIRPHLTEWQAKFRRWYEIETNNPENNDKTPQEIQRSYPEYDELMADLGSVNKNLMKYRSRMYELISKS